MCYNYSGIISKISSLWKQTAMCTSPLFAEQENRAAKRILIVESDAALAVLLEVILSGEQHYCCAVASTCCAALTIAGPFTPDLFILNTCLPGGDSFALYDRLHAKQELAGVPTIILSTHLTRYQRAIEARQLVGMDLPFDLDALLDTVDNLL